MLLKNLLVGYHGELKVNLFIIQGLYRDYTTPKRLKVTYSTSKKLCALPKLNEVYRDI